MFSVELYPQYAVHRQVKADKHAGRKLESCIFGIFRRSPMIARCPFNTTFNIITVLVFIPGRDSSGGRAFDW